VASAPGRVNLIGEHTDYTGGLVLPMAIDRETLFAIRTTGKPLIEGLSLNFREEVQAELGEFDRGHRTHWFRYVLGVLNEVHKAGYPIPGFEFCVLGDVPMGSGLSSSASLSVAAVTAMQCAFGFALEKKAAALLCQRAENDFAGVQCGIMDQFISACGVAGHALRLDCLDLSYEPFPAEIPGCTWLVIDSKKRRGLVDSQYNARKEQCFAGLKSLQSAFPERGITGLRGITVAEASHALSQAHPDVRKRVRHVVSENLRVFRFCESLRARDLGSLRECLFASHESLRADFEVSCPELDALVNILSGVRGVIGARLTGAGFGGCVIALVREPAVGRATDEISKAYPGIFPEQRENVEIWPVQVAGGAKVVYARQESERTAG
jgi:galactokinase